ncbi:MAG: tRNA 2-thiouridine(34) synthase MnmA [Patescibacteria group bacterium]
MKSNKKTVFVGLSGGVDSAVSAALLKQATPKNFLKFFGRPTPKGFSGYEVVGVFIKTWHPDFLECNEEEERHDAMRVAAFLDIPFLTFDFEDVYKKEVADYMISEYRAGRTPNPDVMCNKEVKFGAFFKEAISMGADFVATGHYARIADSLWLIADRGNHKLKAKSYELKVGLDPSKDQSYFLWTLKQEQLKKILFPIGHLKKTEVRKLAKKFNLPVAEKKDSQGICFLGAVDLKEFLRHYIKEKKGKTLNEKREEIGYHNGVVFYTLGERHGFTITQKSPNDGPYYIIDKNIKKNILIVSQDKNFKNENLKNSSVFVLGDIEQGTRDALNFSGFHLEIKNTNWIPARQFRNRSEIPKNGKNYQAQIRYHGEFLPCKIKIINKKSAKVSFNKPVLVDKGQSCVIYDKNVVLGGGVIK